MKNGVSAGFYLFLTLFIVAGMTVPGLIIAQDFSGTPTSGTAPLEVQFTDESADTPTGWAWYFGDEDWTAKTWSEVNPDAPWAARHDHTSVVLPNGSIVIMGGNDGSYRNDVWRSEDQGASWTEMTASAGWSARDRYTSVVLPDGSIVLMGGIDGSRRNDVWRSEDQGATWTEMTASAEWSARAMHISVVLPDGSIVLMGGDDGSPRNDVWRSEDQGASWTEMTSSASWSARLPSSAVLPDGSIILMGGFDGSDRNDVWRSNDQGANWTEITASAEWSARYEHTSEVLPDGSIILMGGFDGTRKNDVWRSNDQGETWVELTGSANWSERYSQSSVVMPDGSIVLMGGYSGTRKNDVWRMETASSSEQNPEHTYTEAGTYDVALQSYNADGFGSIQKPEYIEVSAALFCGGTGIDTDPYLICTADQLNNIREDLTAHYKLSNDINLDVAPYNEGEGWEPIGTYVGGDDPGNVYFTGSLDGDNKSISKLYINYTTGTKMAALFELTDGAEFKDLDFTNVDITSTYYAGALVGMTFNTELVNISSSGQITGFTRIGGIIGAGYDSNISESSSSCSIETINGTNAGGLAGQVVNTTVTNSFATGDVKGGDELTGGLLGEAGGSSEISGCYATGKVTTEDGFAGGLVGDVYRDATINNSYATGDVIAGGNADKIGGLAGSLYGTIENSYATGNITGYRHVGGLVGISYYSTYPTPDPSEIKNSFATGNVTGSDVNIGGLVGNHSGDAILNSYATGDVEGTSNVGGLVGLLSATLNAPKPASVSNSYSVGYIVGEENTGGLVGGLNSDAYTTDAYITSNSYYDSEASGQSDTGKGTPKTTAEMKQLATFSTDWDITPTSTDLNDGYPFLAWQDDSEESVWLITGEPLFCGGEGTEADPYLICTADQLNNIREDLTAHYKLANDIDLDVAPYNEGEGWEPIGTYLGWEDPGNIPFTGNLDGDDKSISNLYINYTTGRKMAALFELTDGADFKDLDFTSVDITSTYHAGALVGMAFNTEIANISSSGQIAGYTRVGGIIGESHDSAIKDSNSSCSIITDSVGGGLAGQITDTNVSNSFATGSVSGIGDYEMGGLLGDASGNSIISDCYATGDVTTVSNEAGGLIGYVNYDVKIINSYATGDVNGGSNSDDVGGLVGYFRGDEIFNAYATGDVKGNKSVGGLAGHLRGASISLKNTYSVGAVDGAENVGGLIGEFESGTITNSFYDSETSGQSDTGKGTPKTTAEMKQQSTFTTSGSDWDFDNLWAIESGDHISYPYFGNSEEAPEQDPPPGLTQVGGFAENPRLIAAAGKKTAVTTAHILFGDDDDVTITRKPYRGRLLLDGTEVVNGDEILKTEVEGNELEFEHEGDRTESEYRYTDFLYATSAEERTLPVDLAGRGIEYENPEGWFLFSSPEENQTVGDLLRNMRTDGYPGSTNPGASFPTVYTLDQEAYEWAAVTNSDQKLVPGTALLVYVFDEDTPQNSMLHSNGPWEPLDGKFTYDDLLGYDPNQGSGGNSFYLIGNPHPVPIDICRMLREGTNIATSFYAWMPDENDGNGGYVNYSCEIPSKIQSITDMNGRPSIDLRVPAFAGFWVRTTAENPELSITENDYLITTRKEVEELPEPLTLELAHSDQDYANRVHILLRDDAETGLDRIDAIKMSSAGLAENYLSFYALDEENRKFALRSLPAYLEELVNIPLVVETTVSGDYTLRWSPPSEEHGLVYRLRDRVTGAEYNLGSEGELNLTITETGEGAINRFTVAISAEGFINEPELPTSIALKQNYPNPFNPTTVIEYQLPQSAQVRLQVYDMSGRQVAELVNEQISAGTHTINFDASNLSSGVYMYRLQAGATMLTRKLTVVK
jgi:PKD repeat protein